MHFSHKTRVWKTIATPPSAGKAAWRSGLRAQEVLQIVGGSTRVF
jgi:hypothetical protein